MANIGYDWDTNWTAFTQSPLTLTEGGTDSNNGETGEIDLDGKSACLISIDADYSNHSLATSGLKITVRRDVDDIVWESVDAASISFELPFVQNGTVRKTIALQANQFQKFVVQLDWGNFSPGSSVTVALAIKYGVASSS